MGIDPELVELIGAIYDAVLDPGKWYDAVERIRLHFRLFNGMLGFNYIGFGPTTLAVVTNVPEQYRALIPEYNDEIIRLWGGRERIEKLPLEEPIPALADLDPRLMHTNRYYRDFVEPQGIIDAVSIILMRDRRQVGNVAFGRHRDEGPITQADLDGLRVIAPHLRRAALITGILDDERNKRRMFEAVVETARSAIVLVDGESSMIYANPAAREIMDADDPLTDNRGQLRLRGEVVHGSLEQAIGAAAEGDIPLGRRGIAIPGSRFDGTPFVVHVLPLGDRADRSSLPGAAVAAVFVADRGDDPQFVLDAATMLFSLTPAEARVFELIVAGRSSSQIAEALSISGNTLKWHTRQLFEKTAQHRRTDLVRLAARLGAGQ
jgi:DNA-binding CsgD family transcriptional regulator/PAS domain-containing protein